MIDLSKLVVDSSKRNFGRPGGFIAFSYPEPITHEQAIAAQEESGAYHPSGYGFYDHKIDEKTGVTTWKSWSNCD